MPVKSDKATVYVVDDDEPVRDSLEILFKSVGQNVASFASAQAFLDAYNGDLAGCLVLDIRMPGMSGLELQTRLNQVHSILPIIFITGHGDVPMAVEAMQFGAMDFVQKPFRDQELLDRVNVAFERNRQDLNLLNELHEIRICRDSLTPREAEVLAAVVNGHANKVIAGDLGVSQRTVEIHRARVMEKMRASSLPHLVRMAIRLEATK